MKRVRFAPSPTGSLHVGNALSAVANRHLGDWMLLRIDDTDPARNVPGGEDEIIRDLQWLGLEWEEGPVRQSERAERHRDAGTALGDRFEGTTLLRADGSPTYQLATVVDDIDFGITHIVRGFDHRPNEAVHRRLFAALGATPPEFVHHGLILGDDGKKLAKRAPGATVASLREVGIHGPAVRRYLEELGLPQHDVHYDLPRIRRLAIEAIESMSAAAPPAPDPGHRVRERRGSRGGGGRIARRRSGVAWRTGSRGGPRLRARDHDAAGCGERRCGGDARALPRAARAHERNRRRPRARARAQSCRREPARAAHGADRAGARARALDGDRGPAARRDAAQDRCGSLTR